MITHGNYRVNEVKEIFVTILRCVVDGKVSELALDALLRRCSDVVVKYVEDEKLSGKCPLPR